MVMIEPLNPTYGWHWDGVFKEKTSAQHYDQRNDNWRVRARQNSLDRVLQGSASPLPPEDARCVT